MEDIFRSYWWLLFPLGWFVAEGWQSWLKYRARRDALRLVQAYAEKGQTPTNWGWYQVALFGALAGGFVFMSRANLLGDEGLADALLVAAVVLGALALASLVYALTWKGPRA